jgi:hypothetical protein
MYGLLALAASHNSSVVKIVGGAMIIVVSRGIWVFRRNRRRRG